MNEATDSGRHRSWSGIVGPGLIVVALLMVQMPRVVQGWREAPDARQRIAALLVSWGCRPPGLTLPVNDAEIQQRIEALKSPEGEERVRAAHWLAEHGVRDAVPKIVAAMWSPGTRRPCQLAHSLGGLGDAEAVPELLEAAGQTGNTDLRVCAMFALRDLASDRAIDGLLLLCDDPLTARMAVDALGEIADALALPRLRRVLAEADEPSTRRAALLAVERIGLVGSDDPVPVLTRRIRGAAGRGQIDSWAVRWLARAQDERAIGPLATAMTEPGLGRSDCEMLAAALLAHDPAGAESLRRIATSHMKDAAGSAARDALSLLGSTPSAAARSR